MSKSYRKALDPGDRDAMHRAVEAICSPESDTGYMEAMALSAIFSMLSGVYQNIAIVVRNNASGRDLKRLIETTLRRLPHFEQIKENSGWCVNAQSIGYCNCFMRFHPLMDGVSKLYGLGKTLSYVESMPNPYNLNRDNDIIRVLKVLYTRGEVLHPGTPLYFPDLRGRTYPLWGQTLEVTREIMMTTDINKDSILAYGGLEEMLCLLERSSNLEYVERLDHAKRLELLCNPRPGLKLINLDKALIDKYNHDDKEKRDANKSTIRQIENY